MKQYITPDQLNELSEKGKKRLRKWWKRQDGDLVEWLGYERVLHSVSMECEFWPDKEELLPLLSIGQMIEFLEDKTKSEFHIFRRVIDWKIVYEGLDYGKKLGEGICDALWEAIKEILEK